MLPRLSRLRAVAVAAGLLTVAAPVALDLASPASAATVAVVREQPIASWSPYKACTTSSGGTYNCAQVRAIAVAPSGATYVGGDFTSLVSGAQSIPASKFAALDADGQPLAGFTQPTTVAGTVFTLATDGTSLFVGGTLSNVGAGLAKYDAVTGAKKPFAAELRNADATATNNGTAGDARASVLSGGKLYVGGDFTQSRSAGTLVPRADLAAFDAGTGALDTSWTPSATTIANDASPNDPEHNDVPVRTMAVAPGGGRVYVGGDFDTLNGVAQPAVAAVDPTTGDTDPTFNATAALGSNGFKANSYQGEQIALIDSAAPGGAGLVLAAGGLTNRSFRLDSSGRLVWLQNLDGDTQAAAYADGVVYLGGHFTKVCPQSCYPEVPADQCDVDHVCRTHLTAFLDQAAGSDPTKVKPAPTDLWKPKASPAGAPYFYGVWHLEAAGGRLYAGGVFRDVYVGNQGYPQAKFAEFPVGSTVVTPAAPGTPSPATATAPAGTTDSLDVSWTPQGASADTYVVTVGGTSTTVSAPATSTRIGSLSPGTTYQVSVVARNAGGSSSPATTTGTTGSATTPPAAPTGVQAAAGNAAATVSWTDPADTTGVTGYRVRRYDANGTTVSQTYTAAASANSLVVTGLTNGATYGFDVTAVAGSVTGDPSARASVALTVPSAPTIGTAVAGSTTDSAVTATATWSAPTSSGGSAVRSYTVQAIKLSSTGSVLSRKNVSAPATATRLEVALTAGNYRFTVQAVNSTGTSPLSARSNLVAAR